jgi:hypothetical protein
MPNARRRCWLGLLSLAFLAGCGRNEPPGVALSGRVTYQGKSVSRGTVYFMPPFDKSGRGAHGEIVNGHYSISAEDGPFPGELMVRVISTEDDPKPDPGGKPRVVMTIPEKYNLNSELKVKIPNRKSYEYDFALE